MNKKVSRCGTSLAWDAQHPVIFCTICLHTWHKSLRCTILVQPHLVTSTGSHKFSLPHHQYWMPFLELSDPLKWLEHSKKLEIFYFGSVSTLLSYFSFIILYVSINFRPKDHSNGLKITIGWAEQGLTSYQTHYRSHRGRVFTGQMTQPTVSEHWRKIGPKD